MEDKACDRLGYLHSIMNRWTKLGILKYVYMNPFSFDPKAFKTEIAIKKFERKKSLDTV